METLVENEYIQVAYDESNALLQLEWLEVTANMQDDEYKAILLQLADIVQQRSVKKWLGNTLKFAFAIAPDLQSWTVSEFHTKLNDSGLQKMALIIPSEFIANLAVQQTVEEMEASASSFTVRYFDIIDDAKKWLMDN